MTDDAIVKIVLLVYFIGMVTFCRILTDKRSDTDHKLVVFIACWFWPAVPIVFTCYFLWLSFWKIVFIGKRK